MNAGMMASGYDILSVISRTTRHDAQGGGLTEEHGDVHRRYACIAAGVCDGEQRLLEVAIHAVREMAMAPGTARTSVDVERVISWRCRQPAGLTKAQGMSGHAKRRRHVVEERGVVEVGSDLRSH